MYNYEIKPSLLKVLNKLSKKNNKLYNQVVKKIEEIINSQNIEYYKNLQHNLQEFKRVHLGRSFVLIFRYNKKNNLISFEDFDHHDKIYEKRE